MIYHIVVVVNIKYQHLDILYLLEVLNKGIAGTTIPHYPAIRWAKECFPVILET
jgi:hypothetical protein